MQRISLATESIESSLSSETPCATLTDQFEVKKSLKLEIFFASCVMEFNRKTVVI